MENKKIDEIDNLLSENISTEESNKGRWKGGRYDTSKEEEKVKWNSLKSMVRYTGDNNGDVKNRLDNLARNIQSGILEIRKVK